MTMSPMRDSISRRFSSSLLISIFQPMQLGGEADVLAALADGERELQIIHNHFHVLVGRIDDGDARDLGRAQSLGHIKHRIFGKFDDVDFFAA